MVLGLLWCNVANAKIIYCYKANKGNELLKSRIPVDLLSSEVIYYFEIDDNKKKFRPLKGYWEFRNKIKYEWEDNNIYRFWYSDPELDSENIKSFDEAKIIKFNKNEIKISRDFKTTKDILRKEHFELDRVAGIMLVSNFEINSSGEEITKDDNGMIYTKDDNEFYDYIDDEKFFCENHKGL